MRTLTLRFEDKVFKRLRNLAESNKILGNCTSWETFILRLAKIEQDTGKREDEQK